MGRHAQRKIAGGGTSQSQQDQVQIVSAETSGDGLFTVYTYSGPVDELDFNNGSFVRSPSGNTADIVAQGAANTLQISWFDDVKNDQFVTVTKLSGNYLSPQVLAT